ncbi:MAG: PAS domain-containing protein [Bacteroidetes bacterium]|nr:PAS domain-containing protein [Bacteroidota bacterium]
MGKISSGKKPLQKLIQPFFCVGIGASAGGLEAIEVFFKNMPVDSGLSFVIIQHLSPDYKSLMRELISRFTTMPIQTAEDGIDISPNHIYLIPPKKNMTVFGSRLFLSDQDPGRSLNLPIDIFFRSLAQDFGKNAIGIVLSGTGSDGALGIRSIKEHGGIVMVQDNQTAKFDGMPKSSIATGMVDFILSPEEMPDTLMHYIQHPYIAKPEQSKPEISDNSLMARILKIINERVGIDFTSYKPTTITRRLEKRLAINQIENFNQYLEFLEQSQYEVNILYKDLLIGVTQFFRDGEAFQLIESKVLPSLFSSRKDSNPIRIWCVGCSTGEEAYSLAILFTEYKEKHRYQNEIKIFATDIDREHVEMAGTGFYPESIAADITPEFIKKYFVHENKGYRVKEDLRRMVIFAQQNVIKDPPFSRMDMISCRNMLIYLNPDVQQKILSMFYYSLNPGGTLFLGSSESLGELSAGFETHSSKWKLYLHKPGFKPPVTNNYLQPLSPRISLKSRKNELAYPYFEPDKLLPDNVLTDILDFFLPSSVIVNHEFTVLHVFKDVNNFIRIPQGKARFDILDMVPKEVSVVLSSMLHKAMNDNKVLFFRDIQIKDQKQSIHITARPLSDKISKKKFILISFENAQTPEIQSKNNNILNIDLKNQLSEHYIELEKELQFTKENLQATIEELETSNEELQSTNEELIASNEELQSTNEELQSVNEELYTVNSEYQKKIEELILLNNDMNNLLNNTNIGILYLDNKLRIRKYTDLVTRVINVMEMDLGRPINHISLKVDYPEFLQDINSVMDTLKVIEKEVKDPEGNWNLLRIMPYRTEENAIEGVTITLIDVSRLRESQDQYKNLFDSLVHGVVYQDAAGKIVSANKAAENILGLSFDQMCGRTSADPGWKALKEDGSDYPGDQHPSMLALKTGKEIRNSIMGVYHPAEKKHKWININAIPEFIPGSKQPFRVYTTFEDITVRKKQEEEIKRNHDLLYRIFENSPMGKLVVNRKGRITYANNSAETILGVKKKDIVNRKYNDIRWSIRSMDGSKIPEKELPVSRILHGVERIRNYVMMTEDSGGNAKKILVNGSPMYDEKGEIDGGIFTIQEVPTD